MIEPVLNVTKKGILHNFVVHNKKHDKIVLKAKSCSYCQKCLTNKTFESQAMKNERKNFSKESQNSVSEEQEEDNFSFFSS